MASGQYRVGFDIGGTFTDAVLTDVKSGAVWTAKVLTTVEPEEGAIASVAAALEKAGADMADLEALVHGTTLVSNALIARHGAVVGLLTTEGFTDVLEIGRELRYNTYDNSAPFPEPLVSRPLRRGVRERILVDGTEYQELDEEQVRRVLREWKDAGVKAVAVAYLHSYRNAKHEQRTQDLVWEVLGAQFPVSISSEVAAEFREYERTSTTAINAYVQPLVAEYQEALVAGLQELGNRAPLYVMLSSGGVATTDVTSRFPVRLVESGPAAGALAAAYYGRMLGERNLISFDVGGTTAKACLIKDFTPLRRNQFEVARMSRFMQHSGIPVRSPSIDMLEIGAGGGSIAAVDKLGLLKVGPESAEANPGPACYGRGGTDPTVTDAHLLLGYLSEDSFAGGSIRLDKGAASAAMGALAEKLRVGVLEAAWGVYQIATENMAAAVRVHLAEKGQDPRNCSLFAFGGGGPLHATQVAQKLRIGKVICPSRAGVMSAVGLLMAPPAFDFAKTYISKLGSVDWAEVDRMYDEMQREGEQMLVAAGVPAERMEFVRSADMRFVGQMHEITVPIAGSDLGAEAERGVYDAFTKRYGELYGGEERSDPAEVLTWRLLARGAETQEAALQVGSSAEDGADPVIGRREVYFGGNSRFTAAVYDRYRLRPGFSAQGPALVEENETTLVIGPDDSFEVDRFGNVVVTVRRAEGG